MQLVNERILKQSANENGYRRVQLSKNGKIKCFQVHRLVALAFVPNIENKTQVNHIDENKENNKADNLEWVTARENNNYGMHNHKVSVAKGMAVEAYNEAGKKVSEFHSMNEASRRMGISYQSIYSCVKGKQRKAGGYTWKRAITKEELM